MSFKENIQNALAAVLEKHPELFLIELHISDVNKVTVALDGDNGVSLQDCIEVTRAIEELVNKDDEDYALEVASAGVSSPLKFARQYIKNIGRTLKVKTETHGDFTALLTAADQEQASFSWTTREPKTIGKGKIDVEKSLTLPYSDIKESIVTIIF